MRKTISKFLCMVTVLAVVLTMMPAAMVSAADTWYPRVNIHLLGDSTVASYNATQNTLNGTEVDITGWGQALEACLTDRAMVYNWAISGATTKTFLEGNNEGGRGEQWPKILRSLKAGDYVLIQFGHNDQKTEENMPTASDAEKARAVDVDTYKANLQKFITEAEAKGAIPVLVTSPERKGGQTSATLGGYPEAMEAIAGDTPVIDLNAWSIAKYNELSATDGALDAFFANSGTHFSSTGALEIAKYIAGQLKTVDEDLAPYIKSDDELSALTKADIYYRYLYLDADFEHATTNSGTKTDTDADATVYNRTYVTTGISRTFETGSSLKHQTSVATDNGNNSLLWEGMPGTYTSSSSTQSYFRMYDLTSSNAQGMPEPYLVYDFRIMFPEWEEHQYTNSVYVQLRNTSWGRQSRLQFTSNADGLSFTVRCGGTNSNRDAVSIGDFGKLEQGVWNDFRIIMDQNDSKCHLVVNGALVLTDIPHQTSGNALSFDFYSETVSSTSKAKVYLDDLKIYSITANKAAQMLLDGADGAVKNATPTLYPTRADRVGYAKLPASAAKSTNTTTVSWVEKAPKTSGQGTYVNTSTLKQNDSGTSSTLYKQFDVYFPQGYSSSTPEGSLTFYPVINVGAAGAGYTNAAGDLQTEQLILPRVNIASSDAEIVVGMPLLIGDTDYWMKADGTMNGTYTIDSILTEIKDRTADVNNSLWLWNKGTADRKFVAGIFFYQDGKLLPGLTKMVMFDRPANTYGQISFPYTTEENIVVPEDTTGITMKYIVIDAETARPIIETPFVVQ